MTSCDYLLLGGSQHGNKHTEDFYKSKLEFITKGDSFTDIFTAKQQTAKIEKYSVYTVAGPNGGLYLIGCCNVKNFPSQTELYSLLSNNKIKPVS